MRIALNVWDTVGKPRFVRDGASPRTPPSCPSPAGAAPLGRRPPGQVRAHARFPQSGVGKPLVVPVLCLPLTTPSGAT